jgi:hypothetical protein
MDKQPSRKPLDISDACGDQKKLILEYAADVRKFEIGLFWQRSLFFWGFIGAAFVAYAELHEADERELRIAVACFGLVCTVAWVLQNYGSKYWQEAWEQKAEAVEKEVLRANLFSNIEPRKPKSWREGVFGARRFSVSGLTTALSWFTVFVWIALILGAARQPLKELSFWSITATLPALSVIWIVLMVWTSWRKDR